MLCPGLRIYRRKDRPGQGQGRTQGTEQTGTGQDGYGVVCAPQPFETAAETEAL